MGNVTDQRTYETHPTFGAVSVSRVSCGGKGIPLFGSRVKHANFVRLSFHEAEFVRDLSRDWVHSGVKPVAEVYMSPTQWALLVSSFNGSPIPATFRCKRTGPLEVCGDTPEYPSDIQAHDDDLDERIVEIRENMRNLMTEFDKVAEKPGKRAIAELKSKVSGVFGTIAGSLPFIANSLKKKMHEHVNEAKVEVETFISHRAHELGMNVMREEGAMPYLSPAKEGDDAIPIG